MDSSDSSIFDFEKNANKLFSALTPSMKYSSSLVSNLKKNNETIENKLTANKNSVEMIRRRLNNLLPNLRRIVHNYFNEARKDFINNFSKLSQIKNINTKIENNIADKLSELESVSISISNDIDRRYTPLQNDIRTFKDYCSEIDFPSFPISTQFNFRRSVSIYLTHLNRWEDLEDYVTKLADWILDPVFIQADLLWRIGRTKWSLRRWNVKNHKIAVAAFKKALDISSSSSLQKHEEFTCFLVFEYLYVLLRQRQISEDDLSNAKRLFQKNVDKYIGNINPLYAKLPRNEIDLLKDICDLAK